MQINSFLLLRTTSDKGVPGQGNPCLSPLLSVPALPAERAVGGRVLVDGLQEEKRGDA